MKHWKALSVILLVFSLLTGSVYASLLHSQTSPTKYLYITYDFIPITIEYTLTPAYVYDELPGQRVVRNIASNAQVNTNHAYLDQTRMIELEFNSVSYGTPLDVNSSSSTYAYTQKNFSPYQTVSYTNLSPVARFEYVDGVVPSYAGSSYFSISWSSSKSSDYPKDLVSSSYQFNRNAYEAGEQVEALVCTNAAVAYVNGEIITDFDLESALLRYIFSLKENSELGVAEAVEKFNVNTPEIRDTILKKLIEDKLILSHLKSTEGILTYDKTFDYHILYDQMLKTNDVAGISSLNYVLDCISSYALGQGMTLDEYLGAIGHKYSEVMAISEWKSKHITKWSNLIYESIEQLYMDADILLVK